MSKQIYAAEAETHQCLNRNFSNPQKLVNIMSNIFERGEKPFSKTLCHLSVSLNFCS